MPSVKAHPSPESAKLLRERARAVMPGGVDSPVRAFKAVAGRRASSPVARARTIRTSTARTYIDYVMSWGR